MGRLLTCQFECCRGRNSIAVAVRHSAQVRHATTCMFSSPSIIIRCESSRYIATSPHFFSEKVSFIVRPLSSYRWAFSCALLDSQRDVPEPDSLISSRRGTRSVMRSSEMVRPTSPHGAARCQHQVAVMNTVPEVTILSGERRLQPPPVQCECSLRVPPPPAAMQTHRATGKSIRSATRTAIQWPLDPELRPRHPHSPE